MQVSPRLFVEPPSCFEGQPRSHILLCPRIGVLLAVLLVDCEEWLCILLVSLPGARHLFQRCRCVSPWRFRRTTLCGVLSTLWLAMAFCILRRRTIVKVSLDGVRVFLSGPFKQLSHLVVHLFVFPKLLHSTASVFLDNISSD